MTDLTCWTAADLETQPRIRTTGPGRVEATFVVGVWSALDHKTTIAVLAELSDQGQWRRVGPASVRCTDLVAAEFERRDEAANSAERAHAWLESTRHLVDVRQHLVGQLDEPSLYPHQCYVEVVLSDLPAGALLRFTATATDSMTAQQATSAPTGLWLVDHAFTASDVIATRTFPGELRDDQWWVLMRHSDADFDHIRLDLLKTHNLVRRLLASNLAPVRISLDGHSYDADRAQPFSTGPVDETFIGVRVDRSTDSVVITRRRVGPDPTVITIATRTDGPDPDRHPVPLAGPVPPRPVALMVVAYAIQGLNDLFADPLDRYDPPRSFAEVAYSDEKALFSGRPESAENTMADGYRYVLAAQRDYDVPAVWALNAGALLLLKHSLPTRRFHELTQAVRDGVISVANAGTGAHRNCCYEAETNVQEITRADQLIRRILAHEGVPAKTNGLYFPDSRVYAANPAELASYATLVSSGLVTTVLLDRSTVAHAGAGGDQLYFGDDTATAENGNHLWTDAVSGLQVALIEDRVRNQLVSGSEDELPRGQLDYGLRRLFMWTLANQTGPKPKLFCFGDDIDHLAGNGWFDGDYTKMKAFSRAFLAAVCWVHTHPWMQARTVGDPDFEADFLRTDETLAISSAIDATMDPGGATTKRGQFDHDLHFDAWVEAWAATTSPWLGTTLAEITQTLQARLISWPQPHRNELYEIAWTYFLSCTHESMWSKEPLEGIKERQVEQPFSWEPEDFVISESLQMRNAWVYLNAAVWATWADTHPGSATFVLDPATVHDVAQCGSLLDDLRAAHSADAWWAGAPPNGHGLYWDRDLLPNTVLYNDHALAVLDRNGGRITQLFSRVGGRPVAVSGTNKAYQFLAVGPPQVACDGQRVQNTVYTPNHAYVATDVLQARPRPGTYEDMRPAAKVNPTWLPDNLNAYECTPVPGPTATVECRYLETPPIQLPTDDPLPWAAVVDQLVLDGNLRRAGQPGIVWHDAAPFRKIIELTGRTLRVRYHDTEAGHLVANEFSVDLHDLLTGGERQVRMVDNSVATVSSAGGDTVTIRLGAGCAFSNRCRQPDGPGSRVLTENIEIVGRQAGGFDYTVELPG